jgi:hypothetical protein
VSWELSIWPANKSGAPRTITQADTVRGVDDGFDWQLTPFGGTVQLKMNVVNGLTQLPPLGIVALKVNGQAAFYGRVPDPSHAQSQDIEEQLVQGGRTILDSTLMDGKAYRGEQGVYTIVRDILSRLTPPTLTYLPTLIGNGTGTDTGPTLSTVYKPTAPLSEVLTDLAKTAGVGWDVDVQGRIFFGQAAPAGLTVAYAGQPWQRLRVQGRETVTQAVLRVATAPSEGVTAITQPALNEQIDYLPASITKVATAAEHPNYLAQKAFSAPEGITLTGILRTGGMDSRTMVDTANAFDADPVTYSSSLSSGLEPYLQLSDTTQRVIGVRIRYTLSEAAEGYLVLAHLSSGFGVPGDFLRLPLQATDTPTDAVLIGPPSAFLTSLGVIKSIGQVTATAPTGTTNILKVYDMALIVVDEAAALRVAESYLQLPYATPAELTLPGLVTPSPTLTVTGSPDGDLTGSTALWEYSYRAGTGERTLIRLGSDGQSDAARAIKFAVKR